VRPGHAAGLAAVALYAVALGSVGLTRDWELLHEDNGALHTTFALSHLELGLGRTLAHDLFHEPRSGAAYRYGHHPPGPGLLLAAAFAAADSAAPAVARTVAIAFHLGSIVLMVAILARLLAPATALFGGALMATLPMGAYFGRMVNYEPLCLLPIMAQLFGYVALRQGAPARGLAALVGGIALGGLIDWPSFFFAAAVALAMAVDAVAAPGARPLFSRRSRRTGCAGGAGARDGATTGPPDDGGLAGQARHALLPAAAVTVSALVIMLVDVAHLWVAGGGSIRSLAEVMARPRSAGWGAFDALTFLASQAQTARRYFTDAGLASSLLVAAALCAPRWRMGVRLLDARDAGLLRRWLAVSGGAAIAYVLAAPSWARVHPYWQFYALPYVALSMLLVARLLWRGAAGRRSALAGALLAVFALDAAIGAASTLHYRHTQPSAHAVKQTAELRARYLAPAHLPIDAIRRLGPGAPVTVEGFVTVPPGLFTSFTGEQGFAIQDPTGGLYVALPERRDVPLGAKVRVTGNLADIAKLLVVRSRPDMVTPLRGHWLLAPEVTRTGRVGAGTEGRLVSVRGTITRPVGDDRPYGYKLFVDDGSGECQVFVPASTGIDPLANPAFGVGRPLAAAGFSGRYEHTHEVIPRFARDLAPGAP
jgi:hypothetical protein